MIGNNTTGNDVRNYNINGKDNLNVNGERWNVEVFGKRSDDITNIGTSSKSGNNIKHSSSKGKKRTSSKPSHVSSVITLAHSLKDKSLLQKLHWMLDPSFPRPLPPFKRLSYRIRQQHNALGGEVVGYLDLSQSSSLKTGLIAKEWCEWLPALHYVPVDPTWVWIQDARWLQICRDLFPTASFLDGNVDCLPPVDIFLLSKITLSQCNLVLEHCPASLLLSSSRLPTVKGWVHRFWRVKHSWVGGCTD